MPNSDCKDNKWYILFFRLFLPFIHDRIKFPACLVALGRVYEGSTVIHNTHLLPGQVKVGVEEVIDADAPVPVPTDEVSLVGQAIHTFLAWPTHLVKSLSQQVLIVLTICFFFSN